LFKEYALIEVAILFQDKNNFSLFIETFINLTFVQSKFSIKSSTSSSSFHSSFTSSEVFNSLVSPSHRMASVHFNISSANFVFFSLSSNSTSQFKDNCHTFFHSFVTTK